MKKSRFTDSQILAAIKRVEAGVTVPEMCRELGISSATFYTWWAKYGGMDVLMMSRTKELEAENARLCKMYVEEKLKACSFFEHAAPAWLRRRPLADHATAVRTGCARPRAWLAGRSPCVAWHRRPSSRFPRA